MIAAQLLAYYFTELKDDQVKKVSPSRAAAPRSGRGIAFRHPPAAAAAASILLRPAFPRPALVGLQGVGERLRPLILPGIISVCMCVQRRGKTPEIGLLAAVSLKRAVDVRWAPGPCGVVAVLGPGGLTAGPVWKGLSAVGGGMITEMVGR